MFKFQMFKRNEDNCNKDSFLGFLDILIDKDIDEEIKKASIKIMKLKLNLPESSAKRIILYYIDFIEKNDIDKFNILVIKLQNYYKVLKDKLTTFEETSFEYQDQDDFESFFIYILEKENLDIDEKFIILNMVADEINNMKIIVNRVKFTIMMHLWTEYVLSKISKKELKTALKCL